MIEYYEANKRSFILFGSVLFILSIVLYFLLLRPLLADYKNEQLQIANLQQEIGLLEAQLENLQSGSEDLNLEQLILENKVPSERELDEYILALQQLQLYTESKIESVNFAYDSSFQIDIEIDEEETDDSLTEELEQEGILNDVTIDEETMESTNDPDEEDTQSTGETPLDVKIDPQLLKEKPEQLKVMTVLVEAVSSDFDELIELLQMIESNERISIVTSLTFTKPGEQEIYFDEFPTTNIPFTLEITTFYFSK